MKKWKDLSKRERWAHYAILGGLAFLAVKCSLPQEADKDAEAIATKYVQALELKPSWNRVELIEAEENNFSLAIYYKSAPLKGVARTDTRDVTRSFLQNLMAQGRSPIDEKIKISVSAFSENQGESGQTSMSYGRSRYMYFNDAIEYIERD